MQPYRECPVVSGQQESVSCPASMTALSAASVCDITASSRPGPQCNTQPGPSSCRNSPHVVTVTSDHVTVNEPEDRFNIQGLFFGSVLGFHPQQSSRSDRTSSLFWYRVLNIVPVVNIVTSLIHRTVKTC